MIQDDDIKVISDTSNDADFEAQLNEAIEYSLLLNEGRELSWEFPINMYTSENKMYTKTFSFYPGLHKGDLKNEYRKYVKEMMYKTMRIIENNKKIVAEGAEVGLKMNKLFTRVEFRRNYVYAK